MCDDHHHEDHGSFGAVSRRRVLQGMVALAALAGFRGVGTAAAAPLPPRSPSTDGLNAYVLGMHLHASASEGLGSVRAQLAQAALNGFDVAWFTEHDWRRRRLLFRPAYHFLANDVVYGGRWNVARMGNVGPLASAAHTLVTSPVSPNDPASSKGSLRLRATSSGSAVGTVRMRIAAEGGSRTNYRGRIAGRTIAVDVLPTNTGPDAWGEVLFRLSRHLGNGTRPAGPVALVYRLRSNITSRAYSSQGLTGFVDVPMPRGEWGTLSVDLTSDVAQIWPDLDPRDNSLTDIQFHVASRRRVPGEFFFSYLRFEEQAGYDAVGVERELLAAYAAEVPGVLGLAGTEISLGPHINQYGGPQDDYDYGAVTRLGQVKNWVRPSIVEFIHSRGGLASINHPFKPGDTGSGATAAAVATDLLAIRAGGADILEVGYANAHGGDLAEHLAVWDTLSRNSIFLTGNGVSDDHSGTNWAGQKNRFYTAAWAGALDETTLVDSLARGRGYVGFLGGFGGTIDMSVDGAVPMGSVSISELTSRTLRVDVTGIPTGGAVQVVRGTVDNAGTGTPYPNSTVTRTLGEADLGSSNLLEVDTSEDCFHRLEVINSAGAVVGFGQPIWVLKSEPTTGIPEKRRTLG